jgi:anti-anti-sigma factor
VTDRPGPGRRLVVEVREGTDPAGALVRVHGEIDLATVPVLEHRLETLIGQATHHIVLDLSDVPFCDVSALNALLRIQAQLRSHGGRLTVLGPCPALALMLAALGLADRLHVELLAGGDVAGKDGTGFGG